MKKANNHIIEFLVCPWKDNPAKLENFYRVDESIEGGFLEEKEILHPKFIDARKVKNTRKNINETTHKTKIKDPYSDILKELK